MSECYIVILSCGASVLNSYIMLRCLGVILLYYVAVLWCYFLYYVVVLRCYIVTLICGVSVLYCYIMLRCLGVILNLKPTSDACHSYNNVHHVFNFIHYNYSQTKNTCKKLKLVFERYSHKKNLTKFHV